MYLQRRKVFISQLIGIFIYANAQTQSPIWRHFQLATMKECEQKFPVTEHFDSHPRHTAPNCSKKKGGAISGFNCIFDYQL
jgi:hypothetical protein